MTSENVYHVSFIQLIERNFPIEQHRFIFRTKKFNRNNYKSSTQVESRSNFLSLLLAIPTFLRAKKVYLHYLPYGPSLLFWSFYSLFSNRLVWIYWGGDITVYNERNKSITSRIYEVCRKIIITRLKNIAGFLDGDFNLIKEIYKTRATYTQVIYPIPINRNQLEETSSSLLNQKKEGVTYILAGNSGDPSNNHLEIFDLIKKYKEENIEIICPLSYGPNQEYISKVIQEGQSLFGSVFIPLTNFLKISEYSELLNKIDIAIMNHNRQQGLGNIAAVILLGKKVFIREETTTFTYFKTTNISVWNTLGIQNMSFQEFIYMNPYDAKRNKELILNVFSENNYVELWNNVLSIK